jgi:hypothetical protein
VTDVADFHGLVPEDIAKQVLQVRGDIESKKFTVPYITTPSQ